MHIEINSGGLDGLFAVADYNLDMSSFISRVEDVVSSFKVVAASTCCLSGGVGDLAGALESVNARVELEEEKLQAAKAIQKQSNDFLELAVRVDKQVAALVNKNKEEFYRVNPWLRPVANTENETPWYEEAWNWLCKTGEKIKEGLETAWEWTKETAKKIWDSAVEFYQEHKKIINTVLIIVGAVAAIVAVIASGGVALVPLLSALGLSASAAMAISTAVAVVAVVSTVASSVLNIADIWFEIDNPFFNSAQKVLNITAAVSNLAYSIGNIYNSIKHIDPREFVASQSAQPAPASTDVTFDDSLTFAQDEMSDTRYFSKGNNYDEFNDYWNNLDEYSYSPAESPQTQYVHSRDIEGVYLSDNEIKNPSVFWDKRYSKTEYLDYVTNGNISNNPIEVTKVNDSFFCFNGDGRHRVLIAQEFNLDIPIIIKGYAIKL